MVFTVRLKLFLDYCISFYGLKVALLVLFCCCCFLTETSLLLLPSYIQVHTSILKCKGWFMWCFEEIMKIFVLLYVSLFVPFPIWLVEKNFWLSMFKVKLCCTQWDSCQKCNWIVILYLLVSICFTSVFIIVKRVGWFCIPRCAWLYKCFVDHQIRIVEVEHEFEISVCSSHCGIRHELTYYFSIG